MKRACILLVPALLLLALAGGCQDDESLPVFTRVLVTPDCGVVPMAVEGYAILSGGNETGDPLGANNNLEIKWDFDDGGTGSSTIAYHTYYTAKDTVVVTVTGTDPDGNTAVLRDTISVFPDSLVMLAGSDFPDGNVTTADTVRFDLFASSCDIDYPTVLGDSVKMEFRWEMGDADTTVYNVVAPEFRYGTPGLKEVNILVFYPFWSVYRAQTLTFNVTDP